MTIYEHEAVGLRDGLVLSDEYVVPEKQGYSLRVTTAHEWDMLTRAEVVELHAALGRWLELRSESQSIIT